jgi:predicted nucleotidyltransferase
MSCDNHRCIYLRLGSERRNDRKRASASDNQPAAARPSLRHGAYGRKSPCEAAERLRKRRNQRNDEREARRRSAQRWAHEVAQILAQADESVEKIIGFGSTFEEWRAFRMDSDIDLGIIGGDWFRLMREIPESQFEVSLIELDEQPKPFFEHVMSNGVILYEKR